MLMTAVRIAHAEPWPGRLQEGGFAISEFLVVLADDAGGRALPLWLSGPDGDSLWQLLGQPAADAGMAGVAEELAARMLGAAGVGVSGVDIDELAAEVTTPPRRDDLGPRRPGTAARIGLHGRGGTRQVVARLGYGLALAAAAGAPVRVADAVWGRLAVPARAGDLPGRFLPPEAALGRPHPGARPRFEPGNLAFTDGLDRWEFGGSFRREASEPHWNDYSCTAEGQRAVLASAVPEPYGFAGLVQTIAADDYRGGTVTFRGELRIQNVADRAGLHLAVGPPPGPVRHLVPSAPRRVSLTVAGSQDWAGHEVTVEVPGDAGIIRFGVFLAGRGRAELRRPDLIRQPGNVAAPGGH
jgi:hypothetical protein